MNEDSRPAKPADLSALYGKSTAALRNRDSAAAIRFADLLLTASNHAPPAILWAVRVRLESKQWQAAIEVGTPFTGKAPGVSGLVGHAYDAIGDLDNALRFYRLAREEQPKDPTWHYQEASVLSRLYRDFEAMERLRQAIDLAPDPAAVLILAGLELKFGDPDAALKTIEKSRRNNLEDRDAQTILAQCALAKDLRFVAESMWQRMNDPLERSVALLRHGDFEAGIDGLHEILKTEPNRVPALVQMANSMRIMPKDRWLVARMESVLRTADETTEDPVNLHFALGKSYDNLGEYEAAMGHFDAANRLRYRNIERTGGFDRDGYEANMTLRAHVYRQEVVDDEKRHGNPTEMPIFILGMVRSGTTLAEQILSSQPDVAGAGEQDFWINTDIRLMDYARESLDTEELREAKETYLRLLTGFAKGARKVIDKQPGNMLLAGALHIAYPNARIIYMRRTPADNAISIWTTNIRTSVRFVNNKSNIVHAYRQHEKLREHWKSVIPSDRYLEVSYEDLVQHQEVVSRKIVDLCGLKWDDACLAPERNRRQVITPSLWQVRQPVYRSSINRWQRYEPWLGEFRELLTD